MIIKYNLLIKLLTNINFLKKNFKLYKIVKTINNKFILNYNYLFFLKKLYFNIFRNLLIKKNYNFIRLNNKNITNKKIKYNYYNKNKNTSLKLEFYVYIKIFKKNFYVINKKLLLNFANYFSYFKLNLWNFNNFKNYKFFFKYKLEYYKNSRYINYLLFNSYSNQKILSVNNVFYKKNYKKYYKIFNNNALFIKITFCYAFYKNLFINSFTNFIKKSSINIKFFKKNLILIEDFFILNQIYKKSDFISNKYLTNYINFFDINDNRSIIQNYNYILNSNKIVFSNYYPIFLLKNKSYTNFFNNLKANSNLNYLPTTNKIIISFFEFFLKKNIYIKITNNKINKINNYYLNILILEYKNFQPQYFKNFLFSDFLKILWYSFFLKDLKLISEWITKFMETLNFKNHKKFVNFFQNFLTKYAGLFIDVLGIKGFFFDIRGKVGVTGSSKKRHICFKFGSLNRSSKDLKINFNQNLVRTYSGVLGLTYIICF